MVARGSNDNIINNTLLPSMTSHYLVFVVGWNRFRAWLKTAFNSYRDGQVVVLERDLRGGTGTEIKQRVR